MFAVISRTLTPSHHLSHQSHLSRLLPPALTPVSANERRHCKVHPYLSQECMERGGKERDTQKQIQTFNRFCDV